jgi:hypothetical protein
MKPDPATHPRRRALLAVPVVAAFCLALLILSLRDAMPAGAASQNRATVVVQFDTSARFARPITFTDPISGFKALALSGLAVEAIDTDFGPAVCSIEGVGCPVEDCFCSDKFWGYSYWDGSAWQSYPVGAGSSVISQTGAIEGWRWGVFGESSVAVTPTLQALDALGWLEAQQTIAGSFGSVAATLESMLAVGANGQRAAALRREPGGASVEAYISTVGRAYSRADAGAAGKLAVAVAAANACLPAGSVTPSSHYSLTLGAYSSATGSNAWALLGAIAISETVPSAAVDSVREQQLASGAWEWSPGFGEDTNSTALAIQALIAAGVPVSATEVVSGLAWLDAVQSADGGFPYAPGAEAVSDVNSTSYVLQALAAAGEDPTAARWTASGGHVLGYLATLQLADGSVEWMPGSGPNQLATQQAIPALLGQPHPVQVRVPDLCPAVHLPYIQQE